jgi:hypothetical protein
MQCPKCGYSSRPRTTGPKSQNRNINGLVQQISQATGNNFDTVKLWCKREAISRGYPFETFQGVMIPWSESRIDTIQAGYLIDTIHELAADLNIRLVEV